MPGGGGGGAEDILYRELVCRKGLLNIEIYFGTTNGEIGNPRAPTSQIDTLLLNFRFAFITVCWLHVVHCGIRSRK